MEEKELVLLAQQGDKKAKEILYSNNKKMIMKAFYTAYKINEEIDKDDTLQDLNLIFLNALKNYKHTEDVKFSTYLYKCLFIQIGRIVNNNRLDRINFKRKDEELYYKITSLYKLGMTKDEIISKLNIEEEEYELICNLAKGKAYIDDENALINLKTETEFSNNTIDRIYVKQLLNLLNKKEQTVIYNRFFLMKTQQQIANQLNFSQPTVQRIERRALKKMKNHIDNNIKM